MTRHGFTMLETLLAIALLALLAGGLVAFTWNVNNARTRIIDASRADADAEAIFTFVTEALHASTVASPGTSFGPRELAIGARTAAEGGEPPLPLDLYRVRFRSAERTAELTRAGRVVADDLAFARVRFRYFDGRTWRDQLPSFSLPVAVEVALWRNAASERPDRLRVVAVPDGGGAT